MDSELDHVLWTSKHALAQFEGPLASDLASLTSIAKSDIEHASVGYEKILETVEVLEKLLRRLIPDHLTLVDHIFAFTNSKVLLCATKYDLADHIAKLEPVSLTALANAAHVHEDGLFQVLRYLINLGYFMRDADGNYSNNSLSNLLRKDHWATWRNWADFFPREYYDMLSYLPDQLSKDETKTATELFYKTDKPIYQYLAETGRAKQFHLVTGTASVAETPGLLNDYPWDQVNTETVVDIGCGAGDFVKAYLERYPTATASAFDLPSTVEMIRDRIPPASPLSPRLISVVGGDFFTDPLPESTVYFMRWILHNWDDENCVKILRRVRDRIVIKSGISRLLISETVLLDGHVGRLGLYADIRMLIRCKTRERTLGEYRSLAERAGWILHKVISPKGCLTHIIELRPALEVPVRNGVDGANGYGNGHANGADDEWQSELM